MGIRKKGSAYIPVPPSVQTLGDMELDERNDASELWEKLKKAYAASIISTKSTSEMRRVTEAARVKCNSILMLCRADGVTSVQREIRQFLQRSWT
jgi:hypothetical protein